MASGECNKSTSAHVRWRRRQVHHAWRHAGRLLGAFKGIAGSVRSIQYHPTLPYIASCGLDRRAAAGVVT